MPSYAWTHVGHEAVADLAESRLTPEALKQVRALLAVEHYEHLSDVARWADEIKEEHRKDAPAHSLRLPLDHSTDVDQTLCPSKYCAVQGIEDWLKVLADKSQPMERREVALKFVVHLVGDIHQPLHATKFTGGMNVVFNGQQVNLHHVWDMDIQEAGSKTRKHQVLAKMLEAKAAEGAYPFGGDPTSWALESRDIARDVIYANGFPTESKTPVVLPADYGERMWPVVEQRMTQAGVRLAGLLNGALR